MPAVDRVRLELAAALSDGRIPAFTISAGVVDTSEATLLDELIAPADTRLMRAKRSGRNQVGASEHGEHAPPAVVVSPSG